MNNINNKYYNTQLIKNKKSKILYWSKIPHVNSTLNDLFREFVLVADINNYELTIDKNIIYSKFVTLIYHMNVL
jgi:hypothetical protein